MTDEPLNQPADEPNRVVESDIEPAELAAPEGEPLGLPEETMVSTGEETTSPKEITDESPVDENPVDEGVGETVPVSEEPVTPKPEEGESVGDQPGEEVPSQEEVVPEENEPGEQPKPRAAQPIMVDPDPELDETPVMEWYILKVQSNREDSIRDALMRRVKIAGLERFFGDVIIPIEKVTEVKGGRKRVVKRKLYPGYLVVQMEINDDTWFLVRETPGIGDFTGAAGRPAPMLPHEVARIVSTQEERTDAAPKLQIAFASGDRVKINEGTFENFEGEVESIDQQSGRVVVMINIFGRSTPVELEYWQVEAL
ncbi:MAG: transcription termination/antitermination factor NusG [Pirellulales bacterium]|nr:transcription termination/antitermination factor NusG [Pirellulales bacterium]